MAALRNLFNLESTGGFTGLWLYRRVLPRHGEGLYLLIRRVSGAVLPNQVGES
jgi:hypothetical protein